MFLLLSYHQICHLDLLFPVIIKRLIFRTKYMNSNLFSECLKVSIMMISNYIVHKNCVSVLLSSDSHLFPYLYRPLKKTNFEFTSLFFVLSYNILYWFLCFLVKQLIFSLINQELFHFVFFNFSLFFYCCSNTVVSIFPPVPSPSHPPPSTLHPPSVRNLMSMTISLQISPSLDYCLM